MSTSLVLTVIGPDRPGIVEALSSAVSRHQANWEQSQMARLGGRFAGILRVTVDATQRTALAEALRGLPGLKVVVEEGEEHDLVERRWIALELTGNDHPGIVRDVARTLTALDVNVERLETACEDAPLTGGRLFRATARLHSPQQLSLAELRARLEQVAHDLMVDVTLSDEPE